MGLLDQTPQAENFEEKCLCIFALDVSGSMRGAPIHELNVGLQKFQADVYAKTALCSKLEVGIVTFASDIKSLQEPALLDAFEMPTLVHGGDTKMVEGLQAAMRMARTRKDYWQKTGIGYHRPWIVLITDGEPDPDQDIKLVYKQIEAEKAANGILFLPIGIEGANMKKLESISEDVPKKLAGLNFAEFFSWLSNSFDKISQAKKGEKIKLNKPDWIEEEYTA